MFWGLEACARVATASALELSGFFGDTETGGGFRAIGGFGLGLGLGAPLVATIAAVNDGLVVVVRCSNMDLREAIPSSDEESTFSGLTGCFCERIVGFVGDGGEVPSASPNNFRRSRTASPSPSVAMADDDDPERECRDERISERDVRCCGWWRCFCGGRGW